MRARSINAFIISSIKLAFRDKGFVFWMIAWPIFLALMSAYVFIPPSVGQPVTLHLGVVNHDTSNTPFNGSVLVNILKNVTFRNVSLFEVEVEPNESVLLSKLRKGSLDAGLVIPDNFGRNITFYQAVLKVYISGKSLYSIQVNEGIMNSFISRLNKEIALKKVGYSLKFITGSKYTSMFKNLTFVIGNRKYNITSFFRAWYAGIISPVNASFNTVAPESIQKRPYILGWYIMGDVGMVFLYGGFYIGAVMVHEEKARKTLRRILSTPATIGEMFAGKTIAGLLELIISAVFVILTGLGVGASIAFNPCDPAYWLSIIDLVLLALLTIGLGVLLAIPAKTMKGATGLATSLGLVLAFTTGVWFPKEWMPQSIRVIASNSPITVALDMVRDVIIWGKGVWDILPGTLYAGSTTLVVFFIAAGIYHKIIRRMLEK